MYEKPHKLLTVTWQMYTLTSVYTAPIKPYHVFFII